MKKENNKISKDQEEIISNIKKTITHPSVSALIFGYLKEKDLNLKEMTVEQWKEIEKDLIEIILSEVYPGEEISENKLNFTTLARSISFLSNFIEQLNASISNNSELSSLVKNDEENNNVTNTSYVAKPKFEI